MFHQRLQGFKRIWRVGLEFWFEEILTAAVDGSLDLFSTHFSIFIDLATLPWLKVH
jgi:hypothetical protein